jgi:Histidine kinase
MTRSLSFLMLALRIAVPWWLLLVALSMMLGTVGALIGGANSVGGDLDMSPMMSGASIAFLGGLIVFPPIAILFGLHSSFSQHKAIGAMSGTAELLSIGCMKSINVDLPAGQTLKVAQSTLASMFKVSKAHSSEIGLAARICDASKAAALFSNLYENNFLLTVSPVDEGRSVLQINCAPVHLWLFGLFMVDSGRCVRQVRSFEDAFQARMRAQGRVIDDLRKEEASRARLSEAELSMLRARVEPHFLFNTLAHVKAGLGPESGVADAMLDALIEFLRKNSQSFSRPVAVLSDEIQMVESYLKIIRLRLGGKLRYDIRCPPSLSACTIPSACILVLVENAVKHGIERTAAGGSIFVDCCKDSEILSIVVRNDGPEFDATAIKEGGLSNLQDRLKLMYPSSYGLAIENLETGGVRVELTIPYAQEDA